MQATGTKPLPPNMAKSIQDQIPNVSLNKDWLVRSGNQIIQMAQKGYDVKNLQKAWLAQLSKGTKQKTIQESKQDVEAIMLKLATKYLQQQSGTAAPAVAGGTAPDLSGLSARATTPAQKDALNKAIKMLKDQGLI